MDLISQRFERLTVVARIGPNAHEQILWLCTCDCGGSAITTTAKLRNGHTRSCGCLKGGVVVHGQGKKAKRTPEYIAWLGMLQRCFDSNIPSFPNYGGRGITVCAEWRHDFPAFFAHIGSRPTSIHSIDRIDNDGNYEPGNVRWATKSEQAFNRRPKTLVRV